MRIAQAKPGIRVFLIEPQRLFRAGLRGILSVEQDFNVVGEAAELRRALPRVRRIRPHLVLVDSSAAGHELREAVRRLRQAVPEVKVVLIACAPHLLRNGRGADGVILKTASVATLLSKLRKLAAANQKATPADSIPVEFDGPEQTLALLPRETLTPREGDILACIVQGLGNREIAHSLSLSEQTVKNHLHKIFDKLGVSDRLELALYVVHHRLVPMTFA